MFFFCNKLANNNFNCCVILGVEINPKGQKQGMHTLLNFYLNLFGESVSYSVVFFSHNKLANNNFDCCTILDVENQSKRAEARHAHLAQLLFAT